MFSTQALSGRTAAPQSQHIPPAFRVTPEAQRAYTPFTHWVAKAHLRMPNRWGTSCKAHEHKHHKEQTQLCNPQMLLKDDLHNTHVIQ